MNAVDVVTGTVQIPKMKDGGVLVYPAHIAGEEQADNQFESKQRITEDWKWSRVDLSNNSTTVYNGPCRLGNIYVDTVLSAHACPIKDGADAFASLVASLAAGSTVSAFKGSRLVNSLVVDPDDAATGVILVQYLPAVLGD